MRWAPAFQLVTVPLGIEHIDGVVGDALHQEPVSASLCLSWSSGITAAGSPLSVCFVKTPPTVRSGLTSGIAACPFSSHVPDAGMLADEIGRTGRGSKSVELRGY